ATHGPSAAQTVGRGAPPPTAIVLDHSNSMSGPLGDRPRIDEARDALDDAMETVDPRLEVGLIAFGHRRVGDCRDIETVLPFAPLDPEDFNARLNITDARGRTPLDSALARAADMLAEVRGRASIVVIADGPDSCEADPCARAAALAAERPGLAIHVVAIDPDTDDREGLQCLAEATDGLWRSVADPAALQAAVAELTAGPPVAAIRPVNEPGGPVDGRIFAWSVIDEVTGETVADGIQDRTLRLPLPAGRFRVRAEAPGSIGSVALALDGRDSATELVLVSEATLSAPDSTDIGASVAIGWRGPNAPGDYLSIARAGSALTAFEAYGRLSGGNPLTLTAPRAPGAYEIRYISAAEGRILASRPLTLRAPEVTLDVPARVSPGGLFYVRWAGPGEPGDRLAIARPEEPAGAGASAPRGPEPHADLTAPAEAGAYELRYLSAAGVVLARASFTVILPITLRAGRDATAGSTVVVSWTGPDAPGDMIAIVPAGAPDDTLGRALLTAQGAKLPIESPPVPGPAEIRYIDGSNGSILARQPMTLLAPDIALMAPAGANAGSVVQVTWTGPDNRGDVLTIVPAETPDTQRGNFVYTFRGNPAELVTPATPGEAEIRYIAGSNGAVLGRQAIMLEAPDVTLDAPPVVTAGSTVEVRWTGPDGRNDYVTIVPAEAADTQRLNYSFTRRGSPTQVVAPPNAGAAEIRYFSASAGVVLARLPILLSEPVVTLDAPESAVAGASIDIPWTGPNNENDYITVVPAGAPDSDRGTYNFTWRGNPLPLLMPEIAGPAELRYRAGQSGAVLARRTIQITPPDVTLDAPASAVAGSTVTIRWDGPDNRNDYVTIAELGAPDDQRLEFNYTRRGNPLEVVSPPNPGPAEIRYHSGRTLEVLARRPITLTAAVVSLDAVSSVLVGATISVTWQGPDDRNDFVTVVPADAPDTERGETAFTRQGNPVQLAVPVEPGPAEIRYRSGTTGEVLARVPLELMRAEVNLEAAAIAPAGATIPVRWEGPDNRNDFITIVPEGTPDDRRLDYNFTRRGNPLPIRTPPLRGMAEIRYMSGQTGQTMARRKIELR
ncbi:MAG: VWA domain-containing protein, partial [Pseudomonadota bacterium]